MNGGISKHQNVPTNTERRKECRGTRHGFYENTENHEAEKSLATRFLSFFLALMVVVMCLPFTELKSANAFFWGWGFGGYGGFGGMWGPNVLTNATVQFKDAETSQIIDEVDSGVPFKLVITISGNNVYQNWGSNSTTYRVEVTDDLFLLTDFRNNGFKDNAKSNGFTIHYDAKTGKRYIDFKIANGATKTITLNAMFATRRHFQRAVMTLCFIRDWKARLFF